jgi:hypothetical protein
MLGVEDGVHEFLNLRVAIFCVGQHLTYKVNGALHLVCLLLLLSLYYEHGADHFAGCRNV